MNEPQGKQREAVQQAIRTISDRCGLAFQVLIDWIRSERDARRMENDRRGFENQTTEAEAETTFLEFVRKTTTNPANAKSANGEAGGVI